MGIQPRRLVGRLPDLAVVRPFLGVEDRPGEGGSERVGVETLEVPLLVGLGVEITLKGIPFVGGVGAVALVAGQPDERLSG